VEDYHRRKRQTAAAPHNPSNLLLEGWRRRIIIVEEIDDEGACYSLYERVVSIILCRKFDCFEIFILSCLLMKKS